MPQLGDNKWGKSAVRVSKVVGGSGADTFLDVDVQVLLTGDVEAAYFDGDNSAVLPTDTTKNTIYALARDHLTEDLEGFARRLAEHMIAKAGIWTASATVRSRRWERHTSTGFVGGGPERRIARVSLGAESDETVAGIEGLVVLKTTGSAFTGFPHDEYTTLPEAEDRLLSTSISASWGYEPCPDDTTATWEAVRGLLLERFFEDWSASVQHQGWQMAESVLSEVPEIASITFSLPNQHHLAVDLARFGLSGSPVVFQPVSEPYGDIRFTVER